MSGEHIELLSLSSLLSSTKLNNPIRHGNTDSEFLRQCPYGHWRQCFFANHVRHSSHEVYVYIKPGQERPQQLLDTESILPCIEWELRASTGDPIQRLLHVRPLWLASYEYLHVDLAPASSKPMTTWCLSIKVSELWLVIHSCVLNRRIPIIISILHAARFSQFRLVVLALVLILLKIRILRILVLGSPIKTVPLLGRDYDTISTFHHATTHRLVFQITRTICNIRAVLAPQEAARTARLDGNTIHNCMLKSTGMFMLSRVNGPRVLVQPPGFWRKAIPPDLVSTVIS